MIQSIVALASWSIASELEMFGKSWSLKGSLSNDDGDRVNEKGKKAIGLYRQKNNTVKHCRFITLSCTFLSRHCTATTWKWENSRFWTEGCKHKTTTFFFFSWTSLYGRLEFNSWKNCQLLTNSTRWNKRDKVWCSANSQVTFSCSCCLKEQSHEIQPN